MKLVDILARELKVWPEIGGEFSCDPDGEIRHSSATSLDFYPRGSVDEEDRSEDYGGVVTEQQWQLAVNSLKSSAWSGPGLPPPINTECEAKNPTTGNWNAVKILDHDASNQCAVCREIGTDKLWWSDSFRPVKTADQVAADERFKVCVELHRTIEEIYGEDVADKCEDILREAERCWQVTP